ncbi:MAG: Lrp/AsnC family transcriptional regulator [Candidatus Eremiobacteraeota bacterium]|nr:Lrp/AsnC family transcriptional regulator [Candidatus Eremiobacteraeota bacterium]MBC5826432.1 Lrp/AsnC family transcriptional regulator [Candidatus Eremiobacteraeota bacterium]
MGSLNTAEIDELDLRLLDTLQQNARSTYAELAGLVGLTAPSVHERVKRLESRGIVRRYAAQLDGPLLGFALTALVSCFTAPETLYDDFTANVSSLDEVCEVHSVAGDETYILKVTTRSTAHLDDFLTRLKQIPGIVRTKTTIVLSTPFERGGFALRETELPPGRRLRSVR